MFLPESVCAAVGERVFIPEEIGMSGARVYYLDELVLKLFYEVKS